MNKEANDIYYVSSLIEYIARTTFNPVKDIVLTLGREELQHLLKVAEVNHTLSFEQVANEIIEDFNIHHGTFDAISKSKYKVPSHKSIGKVYRNLVMDTIDETSDFSAQLYKIMTSFITCES